MTPPKKTCNPTGSPNKKKAPIEEITGSPRGVAATVVALRDLTK
jgi:hypothetical protein